MSTPKISVIVPVYNVEKWLHRCIDSILAQTFTDFELLLIDDGSTDASGAICDEYAQRDSRVRVFHKPNGGVSSARNLGLDNAQGEWIAFCDSDDLVLPKWLDNYRIGITGDAVMVSQGMIMKWNHGAHEECERSYRIGESFVRDTPIALTLLFENNLGGYIGNKFYKNELIQNRGVRFREWVVCQEDEIFQYDYLRKDDRISYVDKVAYVYYCPESATKYSRFRQLDKNLLRYELLSEFIDDPANTLRLYVEDECKLDLLDSCLQGNISERRTGMKHLRLFVKEHKNTIGLNPLISMCIICDGTYILSGLTIWVARCLRKMLGNA